MGDAPTPSSAIGKGLYQGSFALLAVLAVFFSKITANEIKFWWKSRAAASRAQTVRKSEDTASVMSVLSIREVPYIDCARLWLQPMAPAKHVKFI